MKNILVAPDKFKFTLSSSEVVNAIYKGFAQFKNVNIFKLPLADGGEGTSEILSVKLTAERVFISVNNPLFKKVDTYYYFSENSKTAIIDLASASGLNLLKKEKQNPMFTSSYGTGEIILDALKKGAKKIIIGMGGSAINDFGIGASNALGYSFLDYKGKILAPLGKNLIHISKIDDSNISTLLNDVEIIGLYDVKNILFGESGASYIYAKQKGASKEDVKILDKGLRNIAELVKSKFKIDVSNIVGGGAAGGFGAGIFTFFNAKLEAGSKTIFKILDIDSYLNKADLIITGEGKFDEQSLNGKLTGELIKKAEEYKIPIIIICGQAKIDKDFVNSKYLQSIIPLFNKEVDMEIAKNNTTNLLYEKAQEIINKGIF